MTMAREAELRGIVRPSVDKGRLEDEVSKIEQSVSEASRITPDLNLGPARSRLSESLSRAVEIVPQLNTASLQRRIRATVPGAGAAASALGRDGAGGRGLNGASIPTLLTAQHEKLQDIEKILRKDATTTTKSGGGGLSTGLSALAATRALPAIASATASVAPTAALAAGSLFAWDKARKLQNSMGLKDARSFPRSLMKVQQNPMMWGMRTGANILAGGAMGKWKEETGFGGIKELKNPPNLMETGFGGIKELKNLPKLDELLKTSNVQDLESILQVGSHPTLSGVLSTASMETADQLLQTKQVKSLDTMLQTSKVPDLETALNINKLPSLESLLTGGGGKNPSGGNKGGGSSLWNQAQDIIPGQGPIFPGQGPIFPGDQKKNGPRDNTRRSPRGNLTTEVTAQVDLDPAELQREMEQAAEEAVRAINLEGLIQDVVRQQFSF